MEKGQNAVTYVARSHPVWHVLLLTWEIYVCFEMNLYNIAGNYWLLTVAIQKVVWLGSFYQYTWSTCKRLQVFEGMGLLEEKNHITHVEC